MSLWIKICANTTLEDALLSADAGADAVGFVFARSPRQVTVDQVAAIVPNLPANLEKIGVFVDAPLEEIAAAVETCALTGVQLHFDAPHELTAKLRERFGPSLRLLRVVHFNGTAAHEAQPADHDSTVDAVLVDSRSAKAPGGTGVAFDWTLASTTLFQNTRERKLIAAGGLAPENVAEAIRILKPWGVDVASGVESTPGRKDAARLRAFIVNARAAHHG